MTETHVAIYLLDYVFADGFHLSVPGRLQLMQTTARRATSIRTNASPDLFDGDVNDKSRWIF